MASNTVATRLMKEPDVGTFGFREDEFVGIVSIRDMVALMIDEKKELVDHFKVAGPRSTRIIHVIAQGG